MKQKKVLLYNSINKSFLGNEIDPVNLGILAISAALKKRGHRTVLIPNIETPETMELLKKELRDTALVGVSCMTGDPILNGIKFSKAVKKIDRKIPICWGGYHATMDYKNVIKKGYIDYVIRGQGENAIVELLESLNVKSNLKNIKGLVYGKKNRVVVNQTRDFEDLNGFPVYDYKTYFDCYKIKNIDEIIYCSSRGCPFECTFCSVSNFYNRKYFTYSNDRMFSDISEIVSKYDPKSIFFWDDNFFVNMNRVKAFLDEYIKKGYKFEWSAFARCETMAREDKSLMKLLKRCRCKRLLFGAESGSKKILEYIKKHIKVEDIAGSCKVVSRYKINPDYTFISGFPGETVDDLKDTLNVINELIKINSNAGVRLFSFGLTPGIPILKDCEKYGFKYPDNMKGWSKYEYHSFVAPWVSKDHQRLIKVLVWVTAFGSRQLLPLGRRWWFNFIVYLLHYDARLRLKYSMYSWSWEWLLLYNIYRKHYIKQ